MTRDDYLNAANELREIHRSFTEFLTRARENYYKDLKEASPGIWIHKTNSTMYDGVTPICNECGISLC